MIQLKTAKQVKHLVAQNQKASKDNRQVYEKVELQELKILIEIQYEDRRRYKQI